MIEPRAAQRLTTSTLPHHPYYPPSLDLASYVPNDREFPAIIGSFLAIWIVIWSGSWFLISTRKPSLSLHDQFTTLWFVTCGFLHTFFEGYFILNHSRIAGQQYLFAQVWKEYALSDSRYLSGDSLVLCAEAITIVLWGPLSFLTVRSIMNDSPWRHLLQLIVSFGQAFGDTLYLASSFVDLYRHQIAYSRPEAQYFWFYFFGLNAIWLVIPGLLMYQSTTAIVDAFEGWQRARNVQYPTVKPSRSNLI